MIHFEITDSVYHSLLLLFKRYVQIHLTTFVKKYKNTERLLHFLFKSIESCRGGVNHVFIFVRHVYRMFAWYNDFELFSHCKI